MLFVACASGGICPPHRLGGREKPANFVVTAEADARCVQDSVIASVACRMWRTRMSVVSLAGPVPELVDSDRLGVLVVHRR